jgi:mannose-6-phosphate isomerase-like protein (cupin superfamily)
VAPTIVHDYGIDYKLLKGQEFFSQEIPNYCMRGMLYVAYAMLQEGKSYELHSHADHEEVYFIISGSGTMTIEDETCSIRDGDAIYIPAGNKHSISNTGEGFLVFLAFSSQVSEEHKK